MGRAEDTQRHAREVPEEVFIDCFIRSNDSFVSSLLAEARPEEQRRLRELKASKLRERRLLVQPIDKASGDTVKIGMMISLTGSGVQCGEECQALAEIFEDVINNRA